MASISKIVVGLLSLILCISIGLVDLAQSLPIRLVGGSTTSEGRVEIFYDGQWGTVCDDSWDYDDAQVVCRQLGFFSAVAWRSTTEYGQGTGPILLDNVHCYGYESSLASCPSNDWYNHNCVHSEDAGVRCFGNHLDVRLTNFDSRTHGTSGSVEVSVNGTWGSISYYDFDSSAAEVVCRQLELPTENVVVISEYGSFPTALDYVNCDGDEASLGQCDFSVTQSVTSQYYYSYDYYPDYGSYTNHRAGVRCEEPPRTSTRVVGTMSFVGISLFLVLVLGIVMVYRSCNAKANSNIAVEGTELTTVTNGGSTQSNQCTASPSAVMTQGAPICCPPPVAAPVGGTLPPPYPTQAGTAYGHPQGISSQSSGLALSGEQSQGSQQPGPGQVTSGPVEPEYLEANPEAPGEESAYVEPNPAPTPSGENTYQQLDSTQQENSYQDLTPSRN